MLSCLFIGRESCCAKCVLKYLVGKRVVVSFRFF